MIPSIDFSAASPGIVQIRLPSTPPTGHQGVVAAGVVTLPAWRRGCYYAAAQRYDTHGKTDGLFPDGFNRYQPLAIRRFDGLVRGGVFLLLELADGEHLALLPLSGSATTAWFETRGPELHLAAGTFGTSAFAGDVPLLAWARDRDPYAACRAVWTHALHHLGHPARLRTTKAFPEPFHYLGWCTWEHYRFDVDEERLLTALDRIAASALPIRFVLVDDGHVDSDARADYHEKQKLLGFTPRTDKFPRGWAPVMARRSPTGVSWFGLWLNFNGYWSGIAPENTLGPELNAHLAPVASGALQPGDASADSTAFYDAFMGTARKAGFDFVKVDNQAKNLALATGRPNGVACATHNAQALESACVRHRLDLLNCMAHGPVCRFNTRHSAVTRCSEDYLAGNGPRARRHLHNSYANMPWLGQTVWGDHDMFHSNDPASGKLMAVSKAVSGGPVYLSDAPENFVPALIRPLCLANGRLLRPLAPAAPLRRSLFADPFSDNEAYLVAAPLPGGATALVAYNLTEPVVPARGVFSAADHAEAGCMLDDAWAAPEGVVLYDWETRQAKPLTEPLSFEIAGFDHRFVHLCPLRSDWAAIGLIEKYLSPAGVEVLSVDAATLVVRAVEAGPVAVYSGRGAPSCEGASVREIGERLFVAEPPAGVGPAILRFRR